MLPSDINLYYQHQLYKCNFNFHNYASLSDMINNQLKLNSSYLHILDNKANIYPISNDFDLFSFCNKNFSLRTLSLFINYKESEILKDFEKYRPQLFKVMLNNKLKSNKENLQSLDSLTKRVEQLEGNNIQIANKLNEIEQHLANLGHRNIQES